MGQYFDHVLAYKYVNRKRLAPKNREETLDHNRVDRYNVNKHSPLSTGTVLRSFLLEVQIRSFFTAIPSFLKAPSEVTESFIKAIVELFTALDAFHNPPNSNRFKK
jgi:hypothetical protein